MKLNFRGHLIYSSICLDETNTMVPMLLLYILKMKKIFPAKDFAQTNSFFFTSVTSGG